MSWNAADNKHIRDGRDQAWVSLDEPYEVDEAARTWLTENGHPVTPPNLDVVRRQIHAYPEYWKKQGRVPRKDLYLYLSANITTRA